MFKDVSVSDWKREYGRNTKYLRIYFSIINDNYNYVLYLDKGTLKPRNVWRYLNFDIPEHCKYFDESHMEVCKTLSQKEFVDKIISETNLIELPPLSKLEVGDS